MNKINSLLKTVLVSGGGGDIGIAIGRILKEYEISSVLGCDIKREHAGECVFDTFFQAPTADDETYLNFLKKVFEAHDVNLFVPTSEAEISVLQNFVAEDGKLFGVHVLMTNQETLSVALDKLKTAKTIESVGLKAPWTEVAIDMPQAFPCIFKPRSGQGSKGLKVVYNEAEARDLIGSDKYIWQELLLPEDQEYTCGVFRIKSGLTRSLVMRRTLSGGFTDKGEVVYNTEIDSYLSEIANKLNIVGAVNLQLRLTTNGPVLFEINPRLSSTVMFRHKLGFCDLIWAIEEQFSLPLSEYQPPRAGTKFYRGIQEYIR